MGIAVFIMFMWEGVEMDEKRQFYIRREKCLASRIKGKKNGNLLITTLIVDQFHI